MKALFASARGGIFIVEELQITSPEIMVQLPRRSAPPLADHTPPMRPQAPARFTIRAAGEDLLLYEEVTYRNTLELGDGSPDNQSARP